MLVLYPTSAALLIGGLVLATRGNAIGLVLIGAGFVLALAWTVYFFLIWLPRFNRRHPASSFPPPP